MVLSLEKEEAQEKLFGGGEGGWLLRGTEAAVVQRHN